MEGVYMRERKIVYREDPLPGAPVGQGNSQYTKCAKEGDKTASRYLTDSK